MKNVENRPRPSEVAENSRNGGVHAPPPSPLRFEGTRLDIENNFNLKSLNTPDRKGGSERTVERPKRDREERRTGNCERTSRRKGDAGLCESGRYFEFPLNLKYKDPSLRGPCRPGNSQPSQRRRYLPASCTLDLKADPLPRPQSLLSFALSPSLFAVVPAKFAN